MKISCDSTGTLHREPANEKMVKSFFSNIMRFTNIQVEINYCFETVEHILFIIQSRICHTRKGIDFSMGGGEVTKTTMDLE